jgi:hypothetical protein
MSQRQFGHVIQFNSNGPLLFDSPVQKTIPYNLGLLPDGFSDTDVFIVSNRADGMIEIINDYQIIEKNLEEKLITYTSSHFSEESTVVQEPVYLNGAGTYTVEQQRRFINGSNALQFFIENPDLLEDLEVDVKKDIFDTLLSYGKTLDEIASQGGNVSEYKEFIDAIIDGGNAIEIMHETEKDPYLGLESSLQNLATQWITVCFTSNIGLFPAYASIATIYIGGALVKSIADTFTLMESTYKEEYNMPDSHK